MWTWAKRHWASAFVKIDHRLSEDAVVSISFNDRDDARLATRVAVFLDVLEERMRRRNRDVMTTVEQALAEKGAPSVVSPIKKQKT